MDESLGAGQEDCAHNSNQTWSCTVTKNDSLLDLGGEGMSVGEPHFGTIISVSLLEPYGPTRTSGRAVSRLELLYGRFLRLLPASLAWSLGRDCVDHSYYSES